MHTHLSLKACRMPVPVPVPVPPCRKICLMPSSVWCVVVHRGQQQCYAEYCAK